MSPKDMVSRVVANYPVIEVQGKASLLASLAMLQPAGCLTC